MTADPNDSPQGDLPLEQQAEPVAAPAPSVDVDALADRVIEKLMSAAQTSAPQAQTQSFQPGPGKNVIETLQEQARDPNHPLYATANATLDMMRRAGEEEEWGAMGVPIGHPARSLYLQNPGAFSGRPRHAFTTWQLQEAQATSAANNDKARQQVADEEKKEAAKAVRNSAPGMPTRSVESKPRAGTRTHYTIDEFRSAVASDPTLDDRLDRGEITIDY